MKKIGWVLLIVLIVISIFVYLKIKQTANLTQNSENSEWTTTDFKNHYAVNISYPKNWIFNCCGDSDGGTTHTLYSKMVNDKPFQFIQTNERGGYSNDIEIPGVDPITYYKNDLASGKMKKIDNVTTTALGTSTLAFLQENTSYSMDGHTSSETYIFTLHGSNNKPPYYSVTFYTPEEFSPGFIQEFLNRLTLSK